MTRDPVRIVKEWDPLLRAWSWVVFAETMVGEASSRFRRAGLAKHFAAWVREHGWPVGPGTLSWPGCCEAKVRVRLDTPEHHAEAERDAQRLASHLF